MAAEDTGLAPTRKVGAAGAADALAALLAFASGYLIPDS